MTPWNALQPFYRSNVRKFRLTLGIVSVFPVDSPNMHEWIEFRWVDYEIVSPHFVNEAIELPNVPRDRSGRRIRIRGNKKSLECRPIRQHLSKVTALCPTDGNDSLF